MSRAIARRISRLEKAAGSRDNNEPVELELSDEAKALLRETLTGLWTTEQIEAIVNERRLVPKSLLRPLRPEVRAILDKTLESLRERRPEPSPSPPLAVTTRERAGGSGSAEGRSNALPGTREPPWTGSGSNPAFT